MTPLDPLVEYHFVTPPDDHLTVHSTTLLDPLVEYFLHHHRHYSIKHSITSSESTQIRTQPDKLSTRKRRGEEEVFGGGLELHPITKPISAHYNSMGRAIMFPAHLL